MTRWTPPGAHARADRQTLNRQIPQGIRYSLFLSLASCGFGRFQLTTNVLSSKKPCPLSYPPLSAYDLRARPRRPRPLLVRCHGAVGRRLRAASERVRLQSALSRPLSLPPSLPLSLFLSFSVCTRFSPFRRGRRFSLFARRLPQFVSLLSCSESRYCHNVTKWDLLKLPIELLMLAEIANRA